MGKPFIIQRQPSQFENSISAEQVGRAVETIEYAYIYAKPGCERVKIHLTHLWRGAGAIYLRCKC